MSSWSFRRVTLIPSSGNRSRCPAPAPKFSAAARCPRPCWKVSTIHAVDLPKPYRSCGQTGFGKEPSGMGLFNPLMSKIFNHSSATTTTAAGGSKWSLSKLDVSQRTEISFDAPLRMPNADLDMSFRLDKVANIAGLPLLVAHLVAFGEFGPLRAIACRDIEDSWCNPRSFARHSTRGVLRAKP